MRGPAGTDERTRRGLALAVTAGAAAVLAGALVVLEPLRARQPVSGPSAELPLDLPAPPEVAPPSADAAPLPRGHDEPSPGAERRSVAAEDVLRWKERYDAAEGDAERRRLAEEALAVDPASEWAQDALGETRKWLRGEEGELLGRFVVEVAPPYVVWQHVEEIVEPERAHLDAIRVAKGRELAKRNAVLLQEPHRRFRELFAGPLGLPDLPSGTRLDAVVLWNADAHRAVLEHRFGVPRDAPAPPCVSAARLVSFVGEDALRAMDEVPVAEGRVQKDGFRRLFHDGTHQLLHAYGRSGGREPQSRWLVEGLAEFMGAVEVDAGSKDSIAGASFAHNRIHAALVEVVRGRDAWSSRRSRAKAIAVADLIRGGALLPWERDLATARSWGLVHFLAHYDGGRRMPQLRELVRRLLAGTDGPAASDEILGAGGTEERRQLETEFEWYWDRLLARRFGWEDPGRLKPRLPTTDPPEGRYREE